MQLWERELLEYRPKVGYRPRIEAIIEKKDQTPIAFTPSPIALRATEVLGVDIVDNVMASLSRANDMLKKLDQCLKNDPTYQAYQAAKESGDPQEAYRVFADNLQNINGKSQLDVIPLLEDLKDEMQDYLQFVNQELFDGQVDYNDTETIREKEQESIDSVFRMESEGRPVNYNQMASRVTTIAACTERSGMFQRTLDHADQYLVSKAKDYLHDDVEGFMQYATSLDRSKLPLIKESLKVSFRKDAATALARRETMFRVGDREFREAIDGQLSSVRKRMHEVFDPLESDYLDDTEGSIGAEMFKGIYEEGLEQIKGSFDYIATEHISNSVLNKQQMEGYFDALNKKKQSQSLHQLVSLVEDEYDGMNPEKDIPRFMKTHRLTEPGTYCG